MKQDYSLFDFFISVTFLLILFAISGCEYLP